MRKNLIIFYFILIASTSLAQESIIKEYAEPRRPTRWMNPLCFYPSTLRMVNITQDPNFNKLVNDIEKVLIYTLDSATVASKDYKVFLKDYEAIGYEEYITLYGAQEIRIIGKENEYVGILAGEGRAAAFYLRGEIPFAKIPELIQTFQSDDMLPLITEQFK